MATQFILLYSNKIRYGGEDAMCWVSSNKKSFEVKSYYQVFSTPIQSTFPWKTICKVKIPLRVAFFVWMAILQNFFTLDNI
jgi:hypothetical protein